MHWYSFTLVQKSCMSICARIFCKFRVFIYFRCVEMIDFVVYFPPCRIIFIGHIIINYPLLGSRNWIHVLEVSIRLQTLQKPSIGDRDVKVLRKAEFIFYWFQFLPQYVSLHIRIIQTSLFLTVVCYNNYIGLAIILTFFFIIVLRPVLQMLCMSSVRTVDSVSIGCAFGDC